MHPKVLRHIRYPKTQSARPQADLYFRSDWMEHPHFVIAFTGNEQTGKEVLFKKLTAQKGSVKPSCIRDMSCPHGDFLYDSRCYKAVNLPGILSLSSPSKEANCTATYLCSGNPDAILVIGHALHLEILLGLLKEILSLGPVRDSSIPVVLCVIRCEEARRQGIRIDFSLLHDVLQIPVVPLHGYGKEQMDDLKAVLHYALQPHHKHDFHYDCLDFSPCRLAHECMMAEIKTSHGRQWNIRPEAGWNRIICKALLLLLLFGLTACLSVRLTDCFWPLFFETETILWAWAEWPGMPAWLIAPIIHGAFCAVSCTILVMLPPLFLLFPLLGLLGRSGCFPRAVYLSDLLTEFFIEKPCNTASRYKPHGIFSTLCSCTADHTIPILDRAAAAAVTSGILIWFLGSMAYVGPETGHLAILSPGISGGSLLEVIILFLDHPARLLGLDGTILTAFILGIFSHGMTLPAMMMIYLKTGGAPSPSSPFILGQLLANHGWTWRTALCTCLMALTRFPSLTACLKLRRRPGHTLYFLSGRLLVFILGIILCSLIALTGKVSG